MDDPGIPQITFSPEEIANIKASMGLPANEVTEPTETSTFGETPRRRRGRPRKSPLPTEESIEFKSPLTEDFPAAKLTKRDEREVSDRLGKILTGGTGILSMAKPYLEMTEEEARDISDPLSSYLVRNADTIPIARQVLENYDLAAIVLGVMAYVVRVYHDRTVEINTERTNRPTQKTTLDRIAESQERGNGEQAIQRSDAFVSTPYDTGFGTSGSEV